MVFLLDPTYNRTMGTASLKDNAKRYLRIWPRPFDICTLSIFHIETSSLKILYWIVIWVRNSLILVLAHVLNRTRNSRFFVGLLVIWAQRLSKNSNIEGRQLIFGPLESSSLFRWQEYFRSKAQLTKNFMKGLIIETIQKNN